MTLNRIPRTCGPRERQTRGRNPTKKSNPRIPEPGDPTALTWEPGPYTWVPQIPETKSPEPESGTERRMAPVWPLNRINSAARTRHRLHPGLNLAKRRLHPKSRTPPTLLYRAARDTHTRGQPPQVRWLQGLICTQLSDAPFLLPWLGVLRIRLAPSLGTHEHGSANRMHSQGASRREEAARAGKLERERAWRNKTPSWSLQRRRT